ncbi:protein NRT1/ PTR FAMILY 2.3 [Gossypium raimondii]|uniref:protein NRT1/ PTR FAMILY 2.3 n=1 Tax=Gossypium raimondii TaxID=29730 RepID=UPI00063A8828|nr:protein NRT1/ PTR FAMILY 2.3 [Gossypium raimondii]
MDGGGEEVFTDGEGQMLPYSARKRGGWATFPFIAGALIGSSIAASGWANNLIVYMIEKFHVRSIDATQTFNIVAASTSLLPMVAAILADSFLGCFSIVWISSLISILGIILIALTAMLDPLLPQPCQHGSTSCPTPSKVQFCILYSGIALAAVGVAGTRFTIAAIGANQFDNSKDQRVFFNWFAISLYTSMVLGATVIVYIEENVSWVFGYWLCVAVNVIGLVVFLSGKRYYRHIKPQGSPFLSLAHVVVATIVKRKVPLSSRAEDYYHKEDGPKEKPVSLPSKSFRFPNHAAAMETEEDSKVNSWRLCSVQQVEDFKNLLRIFPLLSSGVLMCTTLPVISTLTILQTLTVDCHLGPDMKVPAGSMIVFILTSTAINLTLIDRFLFPLWKKITLRSPMPLHRIGLGHLFNMTGMAVASLVESRRLKLAQTHSVLDHPGSVVPMFVLWLVPQLVLVGLGEA